LAKALYDLMHTPWIKEELDAVFPSASATGGSFAETAARGVCIVIYVAFLLFVPVALAGLFDLTSLEGLVVPAWQICARLLTALIVFVVGYLGVAWARSQVGRAQGEGNAELGNHVALGIVVGTTVLALGMLVGVSGFSGALVIVVLLMFLLWPVRAYARDLWAGFLLRLQSVKQVQIDGATAEVKSVGPLMTRAEREGVEVTRRNRDVLAAFVEGAGKQGGSTT
jgi:hypothetical protein